MSRRLIPTLLMTTAILCWPMRAVHATSADDVHTARTELCASAGAYSDIIVTKRDGGMPLTASMRLINQHARKHPQQNAVYAFARWTVRFVYQYPSLDAAWLRQQVELACFDYYK